MSNEHNPFNATAENFATWGRAARAMSIEALAYAIDDCQQAARAMATHPQPNKENFYRDQGLTFTDELRRRRKP
jgi:hypothetical protein